MSRFKAVIQYKDLPRSFRSCGATADAEADVAEQTGMAENLTGHTEAQQRRELLADFVPHVAVERLTTGRMRPSYCHDKTSDAPLFHSARRRPFVF